MIYKPEKCECCGQTKTYLLPLDHGTLDIVKNLAKAIERKGINVIHPRKEVEGHGLTSNQVGNLSRPRFHKLIAKIEGNKGNYRLTDKGFEFLNGKKIPKYAIVSKTLRRNIGYFEPEKYQINIFEIGGEYWEGIGFEIVEGKVVHRVEEPKQLPLTT